MPTSVPEETALAVLLVKAYDHVPPFDRQATPNRSVAPNLRRTAPSRRCGACWPSAVAGYELLLRRVLNGTSDSSISFRDLCSLLVSLGFESRAKGSHHIFHLEGIPEILNIQSKAGKAKPYQVKPVRGIIVRYKLAGRV